MAFVFFDADRSELQPTRSHRDAKNGRPTFFANLKRKAGLCASDQRSGTSVTNAEEGKHYSRLTNLGCLPGKAATPLRANNADLCPHPQEKRQPQPPTKSAADPRLKFSCLSLVTRNVDRRIQRQHTLGRESPGPIQFSPRINTNWRGRIRPDSLHCHPLWNIRACYEDQLPCSLLPTHRFC